MTTDLGRVPSEPGSQASPSAADASSPVGADPSRDQYALGLMVEEMGETLKLIGKAMRFGLDAPGPDNPEYKGRTARQMLPAEIGDLHAGIRYAAMAGIFNMVDANLAEDHKMAKLLSKYSRDANGNRLAPAIVMPCEHEDAKRLSPEGVAARAEGIAQDMSHD